AQATVEKFLYNEKSTASSNRTSRIGPADARGSWKYPSVRVVTLALARARFLIFDFQFVHHLLDVRYRGDQLLHHTAAVLRRNVTLQRNDPVFDIVRNIVF